MGKPIEQIKVISSNKLYLKKYFHRLSKFYKLLGRKREAVDDKKAEIYIARLEQAELVSQMAAGVANEIRNPLTIISGYIQLLRNRAELSYLGSYFSAMEEAIEQTDNLIDDFLTIAQNKQVQLALVDLNQIILETLPSLESEAKRFNCQIKTELTDNIPLLVDTKEIHQLVKIMAKNGLEAMPKGGILTLKTYVENNQVVLSIQDEGNGIPPEVIAKLGTPFLSTKEEGSGLGLAICQGIAARHKANIYLKTGDNGTTFYVCFPLPTN